MVAELLLYRATRTPVILILMSDLDFVIIFTYVFTNCIVLYWPTTVHACFG